MSASDPLVLRKARREDLGVIVRIHQDAFPGFFLTELGPRFLTQYYTAVLAYERGILTVALRDGCVAGFVCGFVEPTRFYRTMRARPHHYLLALVTGIVRRPSLVRRLAGNVLRVRGEAVKEVRAHDCELTSLAVSPFAQRTGAGRRLVRAFLDQAWAMGAQRVRLTTDADHNEGANRFYGSLGFHATRSFRLHGNRLMHEYVMDRLQPSDVTSAASSR